MANVKNIAIIAHVDHGKTTLVDKIMYHCQLFRENQNTFDLSAKNPNKKEEAALRQPQEILREMKVLDNESADILNSILELI